MPKTKANKRDNDTPIEIRFQRGTIYSQGYGLIPTSIMDDPTLPVESKGIYAFFVSHASPIGQCFPSQKYILSRIGTSKDRYYKYLKPLIDRDLIRVFQKRDDTGRFTKNIYEIVFLPSPQENGENKPNSPYPDFPDTDYPDTENPYPDNPDNNNNIENNNIENNNNNNNRVVVEENVIQVIKRRIDEVTYGSISEEKVKKLVEEHTLEKVNRYIDIFPELIRGKSIKDPVGFFIRAVELSFKPAKPIVSKSNKFTDFPQREYNFSKLEELIQERNMIRFKPKK